MSFGGALRPGREAALVFARSRGVIGCRDNMLTWSRKRLKAGLWKDWPIGRKSDATTAAPA